MNKTCFNQDELQNITDVCGARRPELVRVAPELEFPMGIVARSRTMIQFLNLARRVARVDSTVLLTGESGAGKERIAKMIHDESDRAAEPFIRVNVGAIPETLLESELFGHARGAFTGATQQRPGLFEAADHGTLLLDEIGEISPALQVKLLRAIQEREIRRVGENQDRPIDVRIIAATNRDLRKMVRQGLFREDLYFRLKVFEVTLPPLRERLDDVPVLIEHFRHLLNQTYKKQVEGLLPGTWEILRSYAWPGNVRELKHVLEHAFVQCKGSTITPEELPADIREVARDLPHLLEKNLSVFTNWKRP
jgi:two-component system, NtrC family, response regulator HydG